MRIDAVAPVAEVTRNERIESIHHGAVVALAGDGSTALTVGDPDVAVYPRSALKPLQAEAMLQAGLVLEPQLLAVACGSHGGEPVHVAAVRRILDGCGLNESALDNSSALPLSTAAAHAVLRAGGGPSALAQNCSGKHAAMLATCVVNGWSLGDYLDVAHPVQRAIDTYLANAAGAVLHTGIDGCGAPTAMLSLVGLARAVRNLAVTGAASYVAMTTWPELVDGAGRADTSLMRAVPGLIAKSGAEAVYVAAGGDGRAVALKIADGNDRARLAVMLAALTSLGFDVSGVSVPPVLGHGRPVGAVRSLVGG